MKIIKEYKSKAKFPLIEVLIFIAIFGYIDYDIVILAPKFYSVVSKLISAGNALLILINAFYVFSYIFACTIFIWFNIIMIQGLTGIIQMIGVKVLIFDEGIKIQSPKKEAYIPNSSITHISCFDDKRYLFIIWNGAKRAMTFVVSSKRFGIDAVKEMDSILSKKDAYIADPTQAMETRKGIKRFNGLLALLFPFRSLCDIEDGVTK